MLFAAASMLARCGHVGIFERIHGDHQEMLQLVGVAMPLIQAGRLVYLSWSSTGVPLDTEKFRFRHRVLETEDLSLKHTATTADSSRSPS